jgi:hypothetical protein
MLNVKQRMILSVLVVISIALCLFAAALQAGYEHPIQNSDSHGNQLGFNNPLTWELYGVLLKSASLKSVIQMLGWYGAIYLFFHLVAFLFFTINPSIKANWAAKSFFLLQFLIFPVGYLGLLAFPHYIYGFFTGKLDGESLTDFPFPVWCIFQSLWLLISFASGILIWRKIKPFASPCDVRAEGTTGN